MDKECHSAPTISFCFLLLHFGNKINETKNTRIKSTVAAGSLFSHSTVLLLRENEHGLQLTLSRNQLRPVQLWVLIVSRQRSMEEESSQLVPVSAPVRSESSSGGRLFIPVLRGNLAPEPGAGTPGLRGL